MLSTTRSSSSAGVSAETFSAIISSTLWAMASWAAGRRALSMTAGAAVAAIWEASSRASAMAASSARLRNRPRFHPRSVNSRNTAAIAISIITETGNPVIPFQRSFFSAQYYGKNRHADAPAMSSTVPSSSISTCPA